MSIGELLLRDVLFRDVDLYARDPAVISDDVQLNWEELASRVMRLANQLRSQGIGVGDRVAAMQGNGFELVEIAYAAAVLGAVLVPVSPRLAQPEVEFLKNDAEVRFAFVERDHKARGVFSDVAVVETRSKDYDEFRDAGDASEPPEVATPDTAVLQLYTSGTTGRPKGAVVTQRAMIQNGLTVQLSQGLTHADVFLSATPLTHAAAGTRIFSLGLDGIAHVILSKFSSERFFEAVARHRVTTSIVVPTMLADLLDAPTRANADLSSLRLLVYGAAPTSPALVERAIAELQCGLLHGYGLTETCPALTALTPDDHRRFAVDPGLRHRLQSIGRPVPSVRIRIVDGAGDDLPPGEPGELMVRSTKTMSAYWHNAEATAKAFNDGWFATGDVGYRDTDGYIFLVERKNDMIISGGMNIYPSEIERVLLLDGAVREAAVVGVPAERWGERPVAFVSFKEGVDPDTDRLTSLCREHLAGYKLPTRIEVINTLPRNETGKVLKQALRERAAMDSAVTVPRQ
ncbi:MAG: Fatty-acyl-CoA synthase [Acidimicrobiales bacterium]|jgi:acyl-CoA synthetase (AMP-forming)/AMP-acid ligase II|nr:Fatty-acyl-CoA synthase [Acidimicrobiales bacterium]